jgi:hypothetical protein
VGWSLLAQAAGMFAVTNIADWAAFVHAGC